MQNDKEPEKGGMSRPMAALDLIFIVMLAVIVTGAFVSALTYDFVSARTPLVILVPLLVLIAMQLVKSLKATSGADVAAYFKELIKGHYSEFNGVAAFFGWMLMLLALIYVAGHYAGIAGFMFILLYLVAEEKLVLSLSVSSGVTLMVYLLFEHVFGIELYRGLIYRIWAGYGIF
jgi:hypothetical protein